MQRGYRHMDTTGFEPWNLLSSPRTERSTICLHCHGTGDSACEVRTRSLTSTGAEVRPPVGIREQLVQHLA